MNSFILTYRINGLKFRRSFATLAEGLPRAHELERNGITVKWTVRAGSR